jgi:hypothetical protein
MVAKQNIEYTTLALADVQAKLAFTEPKKSLIEYFYFQKIQGLSDETKTTMAVNVNATAIQYSGGP